jgi:hypothetical protein
MAVLIGCASRGKVDAAADVTLCYMPVLSRCPLVDTDGEERRSRQSGRVWRDCADLEKGPREAAGWQVAAARPATQAAAGGAHRRCPLRKGNRRSRRRRSRRARA